MLKSLIIALGFILLLAQICFLGNIITEYYRQKERYEYLKECEHKKNRTSKVILQAELDEITDEINAKNSIESRSTNND